ncbi:MAG: hypothetical protein AB1432_05650 [Bacteroidota bacterium]|jgi:hypothetical protein
MKDKYKFKVYRSDHDEIKTLRQWIEFADKNDAIFAISSAHDKIKIVTGGILQEKVLRELTEHNFLSNKKSPLQRA